MIFVMFMMFMIFVTGAAWLAAGAVAAAEEVDRAIEAVREAAPEGRSALVQRLIDLGDEALEPVRAARDAAEDPAVRRALNRAATWILAGKMVPRFREALETQLTFDGQYSGLEELGPEVTHALLELLGDEATEPVLRLCACRALADVADASVVPRLRALSSDVLLPRLLREQVGILLAIFGDTYAVEADITRLSRLTRSASETLQVGAYLELANLYYRIRRYQKAVECYEEILRLYGGFQKLLEERTRDLRRQRDRESDPGRRLLFEQQVLALEKQLEATAEELSLHYYNAACSNTLAGNIERAKKYLRKAVQGEPSHYTNMEKDGDLGRLRSHPSYGEFRKELGKLFEDKAL
jgi:tetratricopeptide (TPR) repeat protein